MREHPQLVHRAALVVIDTGDLHMRELGIPQGIGSVLGAAWEGESQLLLSASHQGIFRLDLTSGECELIWEMPDRDSLKKGRGE